jgi:hypothetical protein
VSTTIEACKVFIVQAHPDPTNVLIAGVAAWAVHLLLSTLEGGVRAPILLKAVLTLVPDDTRRMSHGMVLPLT